MEEDIRAIQISFMNFSVIKSIFEKRNDPADAESWAIVEKVKFFGPRCYMVIWPDEGECWFFDTEEFNEKFEGNVDIHEFTPVTRKV